MTLTVPAVEPVLAAVHRLLTAERRLRVGRAEQPENSGWTEDGERFRPYVVLYGRGAPPLAGPVGDRFADAEQALQLTAVGADDAQAQAVADVARGVLLGGVLSVPGRVVQEVRHDGSEPPRRDDDTRPPLFYAVDLYAVLTTKGP